MNRKDEGVPKGLNSDQEGHPLLIQAKRLKSIEIRTLKPSIMWYKMHIGDGS